ncbi:MAG: hypothetical protein MRY83_16625 [Flavobacteriales bacterium]|nr:hypothetical protein [Flavobacteriales bacterium]
MPLSTGQIIFAFAFAIVFLVAIAMSYFADRKRHKRHYKNSYLVLIGIAGIFAGVYFLVKIF